MYVPQLILLNDGPVTITTTKLNVQLEAVLNALAGARIPRPTISAGCPAHRQFHLMSTTGPIQGRLTYSHVMPSHPTAKNELNTKSKTAETSLTDSTNPAKSLAYSSMGIAAGVLTLITVPFMYASLL